MGGHDSLVDAWELGGPGRLLGEEGCRRRVGVTWWAA